MKYTIITILIITTILIGGIAYGSIQTKEDRVKIVKEQVIDIVVAPATLPDTDYYTKVTEKVGDKTFTKREYKQFKDVVIKRINERDIKKPTYEEAKDWASIVNKEIVKCGLTLTSVTEENIVNLINEKLEKCL